MLLNSIDEVGLPFNTPPVENAALQLLNVLISVPQLSVRLADIPADQLEMLQFWNTYWLENRSLLMDGRFEAMSPLANYTVAQSSSGVERTIATYAPIAVVLDGQRGTSRIDVVNATGTSGVVLDYQRDLGAFTFRIRGARRNQTAGGQVELNGGTNGLKSRWRGATADG